MACGQSVVKVSLEQKTPPRPLETPTCNHGNRGGDSGSEVRGRGHKTANCAAVPTGRSSAAAGV